MAPLIEFIHVMSGVGLFGLLVASFVYISGSLRQKNPIMLRYAVKTSLTIDWIIFFIILLQFLTGTFMVHYHRLSFHTPWITIVYFALCVVSIIWFFLVWIKYRNRHRDNFNYRKLFYCLNVIMIILFFMIIHDAVTQQTWLWRVNDHVIFLD
ncbi:MAG: hypothetical protein ACD_42C00014G0003 [uncultured bacterium]|nr:MAG: hypothetical protein ACD_42C00014G0003 [uncultured bacterium]OGT33000.1 MAG: hypothetical protein A3C44_06625 [Gammaproteobacteria bacterium RIFCSPHIGHO2_02_FULL_39_13]OGT49778.1 MAG: hypothetical protein A3E53_04760 [Gammaproteobacteria bacterium RIFCSPHIGHO2_12_FULL_39_24]